MFFYFVVYTFLGALLTSSNSLLMQGKANPGAVPKWVYQIGPFLILFSAASCVAAIITTLVNHGIVWAGVTVAEMALGAMIGVALPMGFRAFITITSPISVILILGDLWKFWYI